MRFDALCRLADAQARERQLVDVFDRQTRSDLMSRIRGKHTAPEVALRRLVWAAGHRYRLHARTLGASPDLVFAGRRVAVFVDGCFWHGCPRHYSPPSGNSTFWSSKLSENTTRDSRQTAALVAAGWSVLRVWECEVESAPDAILKNLERVLTGQASPAPRGWRAVAAKRTAHGAVRLTLERFDGTGRRTSMRKRGVAQAIGRRPHHRKKG